MATSRLKVVLDRDRTYDIRVGNKLLDSLGAHLREISAAQKAVIITDSNVGPLYLERLRASLLEADFEVFDLTIPAGEASKSMEVAAELWDALALLGIGRDGLAIALGGGVVGDITGFIASTYMRGIGFVQVPTSLLAMVDSSVGGKTAVNITAGKNLVGSFYQPLYVAADLETLATLPRSEWDNGFAEIAKSALVDGGEFYQWLTDNAAGLVAHDSDTVQRAVVLSLAFKARVVAADEKESGERECLNYGHTFAHALEKASNYGIPHGRAVAEGMRFAARLSVEAIGVTDELAVAQDALLDSLGLSPIASAYPSDELFTAMFGDKKARSGKMRLVFVSSPGEWKVVVVDPDLIKIYIILWEQARM
jgi:3-dehydroquinate synthase